jgi:hypothetical protein
MNSREERIRVRAYEIWESQGRTGDPQDHWLEAERVLRAEEEAQDRSKATVGEAPPVRAVEAFEATGAGAAKRKGPRRTSKG